MKCAFFPGEESVFQVYSGTRPANEDLRDENCKGDTRWLLRMQIPCNPPFFFSWGNSSVMGLISDPLLFAIALIDTGSVLFLLVYYVSFIKSLIAFHINLSYFIKLKTRRKVVGLIVDKECFFFFPYWGYFFFLIEVIFILAAMQWRHF